MKRYLNKLLIICMLIIILFTFLISAPVQAASKVSETGFYYTGTTKGTYTVTKSFGEWLIGALAGILDFLLGIMTMGIRMVFVGWTALFEMILTNTLQTTTGVPAVEPSSTQINVSSTKNITIESIVYNRVPILDINFFRLDYDDRYSGTGQLIEE